MAKPSKTVKPIVKSFSAPLEHLRSGLGWVVAYVPFDAVAVWGGGRRPKVKGEINGFAFRTSLFPTSDGRQFLLINKRMQKAGRAFVGAKASFRLEPDTEARTVTIPAELKRVLAEDLEHIRQQCDAGTEENKAGNIDWLRSLLPIIRQIQMDQNQAGDPNWQIHKEYEAPR